MRVGRQREGGLAAVMVGRQQCTYIGTMVDVGVIPHLTMCKTYISNNNRNTRRKKQTNKQTA